MEHSLGTEEKMGEKEGLRERKIQVFSEYNEEQKEGRAMVTLAGFDGGDKEVEGDQSVPSGSTACLGEKADCESDDHVLPVPTINQKGKTEGGGVTVFTLEDLEHHLKDCRYREWSERKNLNSEREWREEFEKKYAKQSKGRPKRGQSQEQWKAALSQRVDEAMSQPHIVEYLKDQKKEYDSYKETMLKLCTCPNAKMVG